MTRSSVWGFTSALLIAARAFAQDGGTIEGAVTAGGVPLRDCNVSAYRIDAAQQKAVQTIVTRTSDLGRYALRPVVPSSYVMIVTCSDERVYQGMKQVAATGVTTVDISLDDPFAGKWKLNVSKSALGPYTQTREETREYSHVGDTTVVTYSRLLSGNHAPTTDNYQFRCDGAEYGPPGRVVTCRFRSATAVEGYQKLPALSYYVRSIQGNVMTIKTFADADHKKPTATLVYER